MDNKQQLIALGKNVSDEWLTKQIEWCIKKIEKNMARYGEKFPSASATDGVYRIKENDDWTNGFWTGMLWMAYEWTNDDKFLHLAKKNIESFQKRLDEHFILDHHDIGFLYSLSTGAGYKQTHSNGYKKQLLQAADVLSSRFQEKGGFIQAWGKVGDPDEYRLIIDSLLNLPLLIEAYNLSHDECYKVIAETHYNTLLNTVVRDNYSTYHTYYFDTSTGQPIYGATRQGNADNSIWARGQSWAILGIPLFERLNPSLHFPTVYTHIVDVFIDGLPKNLVPYWDYDFTDDNPSDKDSSSLAIAASGLIEAQKQHAYPHALEIAKGMIYKLGEDYTSKNDPNNEGLLLHGVYSHKEGKGVDEPNLWGDYFYLEALMGLSNPNWDKYW
ncbi:glycoside hydrolase family 88 protein [Vagococcus sp. JNUCC 83]